MILNYPKVAILATFFGLWIDSYLSHQMQMWFGFALIFTFGILHGAKDLAIIANINLENKALKFSKVLLYYVIMVLIGAGLFYAKPLLALGLFVLVSGYHFGEQHWIKKITVKNNFVVSTFQLLYGLLILFLIFTFHAVEVQHIVYEITSKKVPFAFFMVGLKVISVALLLLGFWLFFRSKDFKNCVVKELFYLLVFIIIFKVSNLIWGFALYFILWHSIPSMQDQIQFLYGELNFKNLKKYFVSAFPYWIISILGICILYLLFKDQKIFNAVFFSFLASITFPHVIVIVKMLEKK